MGGRGMKGSRGAGAGAWEFWERPDLSTMLAVLSAPRGHGVCIESFTNLNV